MATPSLARENYARDKEVADVEEPPFRPHLVEDVPIARPRVSTAELTMQVLVEGNWHRVMPDHSATSCDAQFRISFTPTRRETLEHPLCPICFTAPEFAYADKVERAKHSSALSPPEPRPHPKTDPPPEKP